MFVRVCKIVKQELRSENIHFLFRIRYSISVGHIIMLGTITTSYSQHTAFTRLFTLGTSKTQKYRDDIGRLEPN